MGRTGNVWGYFWSERNSSEVIPIPLSELLESQNPLDFSTPNDDTWKKQRDFKGVPPVPGIPSNPTILNPAPGSSEPAAFGEI